MRSSTLALVTTLDFRDFAKANTHFYSDNNPRSIPETFKRLPSLFPNLRCILIDGHTEADPTSLTVVAPPSVGGTEAPRNRPLVLSIPDTDALLPPTFFTSDYVRHLIYLDISRLHGSLQPLLCAVRGPNHIPHLRILKVRGREVNDTTAEALFSVFKGKLWSLDLEDNYLTDAVVWPFARECFLSPTLRASHRFYEEGRLSHHDGTGSTWYGPFQFIQESRWSGDFSHPERHFADAPGYSADVSRAIVQEHEAARADGRGALKQDTIDHIKAAIAGDMDHAPPKPSDIPHLDATSSPAGITHLTLTGNRMTSRGLEKLIRTTTGQLEQLVYDQPVLKPQNTPWPAAWHRETSLHGIIGSTHVFRPVFSSNLRVLRIHHSLVTGIPTLETPGLSTMARLWIAETAIRERCDMAYPQTFEPDMNPRLTSLTLTKLPRRSVGPLTAKIINFLKLAAVQEQAIEQASQGSTSRRSPVMVRGLRHIRLEFEADPIEDPAGWSNSDDLDAEDLMHLDDGEGFSFFSDENKPRSQQNSEVKPELPPRRAAMGSPQIGSVQASAPASRATADSRSPSARLQHTPFSDTKEEHIRRVINWDGHHSDVKVWIGPGVLGPHPAVNAYMQALADPSLQNDQVGPAMPAHVKAGVPPGELIFYAAWDAMLMPTEVAKPGRASLHGMRDVIEELRTFRMGEREKSRTEKRPHHFWTGKLEVVSQQSMEHYRSARYWR